MSRRSGINNRRARISLFRSKQKEEQIHLREIAKEHGTNLSSHGFFSENEDEGKIIAFEKRVKEMGIKISISWPEKKEIMAA